MPAILGNTVAKCHEIDNVCGEPAPVASLLNGDEAREVDVQSMPIDVQIDSLPRSHVALLSGVELEHR